MRQDKDAFDISMRPKSPESALSPNKPTCFLAASSGSARHSVMFEAYRRCRGVMRARTPRPGPEGDPGILIYDRWGRGVDNGPARRLLVA